MEQLAADVATGGLSHETGANYATECLSAPKADCGVCVRARQTHRDYCLGTEVGKYRRYGSMDCYIPDTFFPAY